MEAGHANSKDFTSGYKILLKNFYLVRLALSAGVGGLLFGYDTGVISGALLYIRDEFEEVNSSAFLQETIVSVTIAAAIVSSAVGGWISDKYGRKFSIWLADYVFIIGALVMALAPQPWVLIIGRVLVGLGVGVASVSVPLYISETSPAPCRGALVSTNGLMITGGQFLSYLINIAFTKVPGTWRYMLGVAGLPAVVQLLLMFSLPESPRWLYTAKREDEAVAILSRIYPAEDVERELEALRDSVEKEQQDASSFEKLKVLVTSSELRPALVAGVGLSIFQQCVGINTVMYYSPSIIQLAGFAAKRTALLLSLITSGLNATGTILGIYLIDRTGRRKLSMISLAGAFVALAMLGSVFRYTEITSPPLMRIASEAESVYMCPAFINGEIDPLNCAQCLAHECGYCQSMSQPKGHFIGSCLVSNATLGGICNKWQQSSSAWFTKGCPSQYGWLAIVAMAIYICFFAPGMGITPWTVNSEIYPLMYRGIGGGFAATWLWIANLVIAESFLTLTSAIGASFTFFIFMVIALIAIVFVFLFVPETKGLTLEQVEQMFKDLYAKKQREGNRLGTTFYALRKNRVTPKAISDDES